jgi:hypothetical protein
MPREGHLKCAKRVVGGGAKFKDSALCYRVGLPNYDHLSHKNEDWTKLVYGDHHEELPHNMPTALGKLVRITEFVFDYWASLYRYPYLPQSDAN